MANITISINFDIPDSNIPYGSEKIIPNKEELLEYTLNGEVMEFLRGSFAGLDKDSVDVTLTEN